MNLTQEPIIEVKNIRRSFRSPQKGEGFKEALKLLIAPRHKTHEALKGISFSIESGSFIGLIGANGAGKTTLLKILSGLIPATSGQARVLGQDPFQRTLGFRQKIALVMGQKAQLWWDLPATDAFDLLRAIYQIPDALYKERLHALSELLDVKKHLGTQIRRLSLGERMKMELIGALLHWPQIIYLDEPTIGLDVLAAYKLREFLKLFNEKEKATVILTSHNMEDIERLCSRVLILKSGELVYDGAPGGLTREGECRLRVQLLETPPPEKLAQVTKLDPKVIEVKANGDTDSAGGEGLSVYFTVKQSQIVSLLAELMKQYQIVNMGIEEPSLESVIQRLYGEA
ncbi:MAG: ATP-binding cassette domain-containing protein [Bdellovibrionota bacterium]